MITKHIDLIFLVGHIVLFLLTEEILPSNNLLPFFLKAEHLAMINIHEQPKVTDHSKLFNQLHKVLIVNTHLPTIREHNHRRRVITQMTQYNLLHHELDKCRFIEFNAVSLYAVSVVKQFVLLVERTRVHRQDEHVALELPLLYSVQL